MITVRSLGSLKEVLWSFCISQRHSSISWVEQWNWNFLVGWKMKLFKSSLISLWLVCWFAEEHIAPNTKLADCLYQWEKSSRINHSSSKDLKLIFKVCRLHLYHPYLQCSVYFIHSFIQTISIAPLKVQFYSEALPTQPGYCAGVSRRSATGNCELPKVPTWRLEQESNPRPSGWKLSTQPMRHHVPRTTGNNHVDISEYLDVLFARSGYELNTIFYM